MFVDLERLFIATQVASISVGLIAAVLSLSLTRPVKFGRVLPLLFLALAGSEFSSTAELLFPNMPAAVSLGVFLFSYSVTFWIAPLFLFHVRSIARNSTNEQGNEKLLWHFVLPSVAVLTVLVLLMIPDATRTEMFSGVKFQDLPTYGQALALMFVALEAAIYFQWLFYVGWLCRIQVNHLSAVKDHFASTAGLELRWVTTIAVVTGFYVIVCIVGFLRKLFGNAEIVSNELDSLFVLVIVLVLTLWGLRPPVRMQDVVVTLEKDPAEAVPKYEKSALSSQQADRIIKKLRRAMEQDHLYRDPNLTLASLAGHVGVSTNYTSQTLNEHMGQSFFDYVNGWRIEEAIPMIERDEQTVLAIAYEVGFNSRSSFYTAFRKKTGMTPSAYKGRTDALKSVSQ